MSLPVLPTARLQLTPLPLAALEMLQRGEPPEKAFGLRAAPALVSPPVQKALAVKTTLMQALPPDQHSWLTFWVMTLRSEGTVVGMAGFKGAPNAAGAVEIGYGISSAYEGRGYTTEAVQALASWALAQAGCCVVTAETRRENPASQRVLQKAGFWQEGERDGLVFWRLERPTG